jgi:hypothetical protein
MDNLTKTRIVGVGLFGFFAIVNLCALFYRILYGFISFNEKKNNKTYKLKNFSIVGIFTLFTICCILLFLYAALWQDQGVTLKSSVIVVSGRWIALSIIYAISILYIDASLNLWYKKTYQAQVFYSVFYAVISIVLIYLATIYEPSSISISLVSAKAFLMTSSIISILISISLYFLPYNTLIGYFDAHWQRHKKEYKEFNYRTSYFVIMLIYYITNFIIWFVSESNEINSSLDLTQETIAYLVIDAIIICFLTILCLYNTIMYYPSYKLAKTIKSM